MPAWTARREGFGAQGRVARPGSPHNADERMLALGAVAVQRCRFPVVHSSDSTGHGPSQSLGRVDRASHGELDLLVDLACQAPGMILGPHEVRFLIAVLRRAVPSQSWCVSEYSERAGEQQHGSIGNLHSRRLRSRIRAPALPDRRIPGGRRRRAGGESRQCYAKGRLFSCRVETIRILGNGDTHIHVEAWWAVPNKIPPINISPQQPPRCIRVCSGPKLRHAISLMQHTRLQPTALPCGGSACRSPVLSRWTVEASAGVDAPVGPPVERSE